MTHDSEVKELFEKLTINSSPTTTLEEERLITLSHFKLVIELMMSKAEYHGYESGFKSASSITDMVFSEMGVK